MYAAVPRIIPASVASCVGRFARADAADAAGARAFARPKSSTLTVAIGTDLDVRWLHVTMDDALLVRGFQRVGDLLAIDSASASGIGPRAM